MPNSTTDLRCSCRRSGGEVPANSINGSFFALFETTPVFGKQDFQVFDPKNVETGGDDFLLDVRSSDPTILSVEAFDPSGIVQVSGLAAGSATVEFTAKLDEELTDGFVMSVEQATATELEPCFGEELLAVQPGAEFSLFYELRSEQGRLGGYGYYPFEIRPPQAATLLASRSQIASVRFRAESSTVTEFLVHSTIDDSAVMYAVVAPSAQWAVEFPSVPANAQKGFDRYIDVLARADGLAVCHALPFEVSIQTPKTCGLRVAGEKREQAELTGRGFLLEFIDEGECNLQLRLAPAGTSQRPEASLTFTVLPQRGLFDEPRP